MKSAKKIAFLLVLALSFTLFSCKDKEPSILKIYVRSVDNILTEGASVRIVGDIEKDTPEYFDEKKTNESGAAIFNLDELFETYPKDKEQTAYFNVYAKDQSAVFTIKKARAKAHLTATATIVLTE